MSGEIELRTHQHIAIIDGALSVDQLVKQRQLVLGAMKDAMKENQHYGKVPGCGDKPSLLQPGAQLLCTLFRLRPEYEIAETNFSTGHKSYRIKCRLFLIGAEPPVSIGEGLGEASSMESKYRYRNAAAEVRDTGEAIPAAFWQMKNSQGMDKAKEWLSTAYDGKNVGAKKINGEWHVVEFVGGGDSKVENPNPADTFNTVLKIAVKRAFVAATITATASNDCFTQDLEDIRENLEAIDVVATVATPAKGASEANHAEKENTAPASGKGQGKAPARETAANSGDWRGVVVHFGRADGPIVGKTLGQLAENDPKRLVWLRDEWGPGKRNPKPDDRALIAAVKAWDEETNGGKSASKPAKPAGGSPDAEKDAAPASAAFGSLEEERSANLESLATNLDFGGIPTDVFLECAHKFKWTDAKEFGDISLDDARKLVERFEDVVNACQAAMAEKKK